MYGADPRFLPCGTKTGCRRLFAEEAIVHPFGREGLDSLDDILDGLLALRETRPTATEAIVKLNEAASGRGNAVVDLSELPPPGSADERAELEGRVRRMSLSLRSSTSILTWRSSRTSVGSSKSASRARSSGAPASRCG